MYANYHTHTVRCHHAVGTEREYIENAISAGIKILGFSDHCPQFFDNGYVSGMRMLPQEAEGYIKCIRRLGEEYKNDIKIYAGFEAEYFRDNFERFKQLCIDIGADYLILGQHFLGRENGGVYPGVPQSSGKLLAEYADTVLEAISTGCFSYIAHPDLFLFTGSDDIYETQMTRLCRGAKALGIPLEVNMLGLFDHRHYPSERFFSIAAAEGCDTVIGCDAHNPQSLSDTSAQNAALEFARSFGLTPLKEISLKKIK